MYFVIGLGLKGLCSVSGFSMRWAVEYSSSFKGSLVKDSTCGVIGSVIVGEIVGL